MLSRDNIEKKKKKKNDKKTTHTHAYTPTQSVSVNITTLKGDKVEKKPTKIKILSYIVCYLTDKHVALTSIIAVR